MVLLRPISNAFGGYRRRLLHASAFQFRYHVPPTPSVEEAVINILHNTPEPAPATRERYKILSCLAYNEPGVINDMAAILQTRGFNIESFVAAHTELPGLSRMTLALKGGENEIDRARRQIEDLAPVFAVLDYSHTKLVMRELLMIRVSIIGPKAHQWQKEQQDEEGKDMFAEQDTNLAFASKRLRETSAHLRALTELARLFEGRMLDVSSDSVIIELCAKPDRITSFIKLCKPFGVLEASRTGVMALPRSPVYDDQDFGDGEEDHKDQYKVDATQLPPG
ncbi:small subunit of acetolactate synthase-domain-containing protein [Dichotomocladium elegans]|nr:small subunit of acetolactate synthase-domain-containing protein [Dichotomocladium elegans]